VYIAGPITNGNVARNVRNASECFFRLLKAGFAPLCPHWSVYSGGSPFYELATPQALPSGTTHADWIAADLPWVRASHAVLRLPGESRGADLEVEEAERNGVPVFFREDDLIEAFF
jgi:hypothetical protein